ncbi:MarR family transcriptional regulator [Qipengyuania aurantiaca]|uniref:MarR family transcriptional regulator n=1 Tax=Qipengyuania aurantiaca TaxID=2867233 RepID=A0ABX8ZK61_9SPHN|nr:helix-turn-helix domain-containing protein [Qipengyuania aurantiaca]QZD89405.1 MarR family transcriptional regulator [Qipengyuania aurantiaca]
MEYRNEAPPVGLGTLLRALLAQLEPAVELAYTKCDPLMRSRYYPVMRALLSERQATVGEIAQAVGVSQPAMTQTIRQMVQDDLLEVKLGEDRRARLVTLSERGMEAVANLRPVWAAVSEASATMAADADIDLVTTLERALAALGEKDFAARIADAQGDTK